MIPHSASLFDVVNCFVDFETEKHPGCRGGEFREKIKRGICKLVYPDFRIDMRLLHPSRKSQETNELPRP